MSMTIGELFKISIFGESARRGYRLRNRGSACGKGNPNGLYKYAHAAACARPKGDDAPAGIRCARIFIRRI